MGRKNKTLALKEKTQPYRTVNGSVTAKNLRSSDLGGVIFGCTHKTIKECYTKKLFGLPDPHFSYIRNIEPGLTLFLFNYSDRKLHGIFEATSCGRMNINPCGWTEDGSESTLYPAQVQIRRQCQPLVEDLFKPLIAKNYYEPKLFWFELDRAQANRLIEVFVSSPVTGTTTPSRNVTKWSPQIRTLPTPNARQEGDYTEKPAFELQYAQSDQYNMEWGGSSGDDPRWAGEGTRENKQGLVQPKPICDRSYSSVVKNIDTSLPQKQGQSDYSNRDWGSSWDDSVPGKDEETSEKYDQEVMHLKPNGELSSCSTMKETSTYLPQKKWSSLFKTSPTDDTKNDNEDVEKATGEVNFSYPKSYMEQEVPGIASHPEEDSPLWGASTVDDWENYVEELVSSKPSCEISCSNVITEVGAHIMQDASDNSLSSWDARKESEEFNTRASDPNLLFMEESNVEWRTSRFAPCLDGKSEASESSSEEDTMEKLAHLKQNCERSCSIVTREISSEESDEEDFEVETEKFFSSEETCISKMKSSGLESVVAKLMQKMEEFKASQLTQILKVNSLEQELVKSKKEVETLKNRCKMLECGLCLPTVYSEEPEKHHSNVSQSIYIVGGFDGSSWLSALDSYSPSHDELRALSPMSFMRSFASTAKLNGNLYILGGVDGSSNLWFDTVESYNPSSNQWVSCPSLNEKRGNLAGASLKDKIFAMGGGNGVDCFSDVEMFDPDVGRWIPIRSMLHKRFAPAAAEINGMLYVVGGYDGKEYLKSVEGLDPRAHSWTRSESMGTRRGCHSLVVLNEKLYAIGGHDGTRMVPSVEVLDPRFGSWTMVESMNDSRGYSGAVAIGESIYVFGGLNDNGILDTVRNKVECYKEGHGWEVTDLKAVGKRCYFSAIVFS